MKLAAALLPCLNAHGGLVLPPARQNYGPVNPMNFSAQVGSGDGKCESPELRKMPCIYDLCNLCGLCVALILTTYACNRSRWWAVCRWNVPVV